MKFLDTTSYILFDLDGTLTDPKEGITKSAQYSLSKFGIEVNDLEELTKFIGPPLLNSYREFYKLSEDDSKLAIEYFREYYKDKGIYQNFPYDKIEKTLSSLKDSGMRLAIATSKLTIFAERILDHFNLAQYFDFIIGASLDHSRVEKHDIITECMKQFGDFSKEKYVIIGDRKYDIIGAKTTGIRSIGVSYGYGSIEELTEANPDYIVSSHEEILSL